MSSPTFSKLVVYDESGTQYQVDVIDYWIDVTSADSGAREVVPGSREFRLHGEPLNQIDAKTFKTMTGTILHRK